MSSSTDLVLLVAGGYMAAWQIAPAQAPQRLPLQGENRALARRTDAIAAACADAIERLRGDGLSTGRVHWLADAAALPLCAAHLAQAHNGPAGQLLAWEWLAQRLGHTGAADPWAMLDDLAAELLPWLVAAAQTQQRQQMQQALVREHQTESTRLAAQRQALQQENERLRAQTAALQQVDTERLLTFLPALFARVFTVLGPADLALLCGKLEPLPIPNPYPEPTEETLRIQQKRFRALPLELQRQVVGFVAELPQRQKLQVRPEMRELLHQLEGK